jgi:hypothetical protein
LNRYVRWREDARDVGDLIPGSLKFRALTVHEVVVLDALIIHQREAVNVSLLGDGTGLGGSNLGLGD